ncbi:MAG: 4-alpha-glucanotransferase [candidate division Zixibacteria bacterium]|nr:4-alpha-glucanotransferase [candidate division Zixibacteria bacterium]
MERRGSGILLHITSLPSPYGIGDLGPWSYRFVDFLAEAKQSFWQILPLNYTGPAYGNSPYHSISAFACNPLLISPALMIERGFICENEVLPLPDYPEGKVDFETVIQHKSKIFHTAYEHFKKQANNPDYEKFCSENSSWLEDYALFMSLKSYFHEQTWNHWPVEVRQRHPEVLQSLKQQLRDKIEMEKFLQYLFVRQWISLKQYCNHKGIQIVGDLPIYVQYDSADLWTNPEIFKLDDENKPYVISGAPPDYYSETGQLWGNPVYQWDVLKRREYDWWVQRLERNLKLFDFLRIDHFRGLVGYWEVPATEKIASNGKWVEAPAVDFFDHLIKKFPHLPIIAEDLGTITPDVEEVMHRFQFPGMKVLLFAFGDDNPMHPYLPHTYDKNCVVYTGTHDNNTVRGWFEKEASPEDKKRLSRYLGREVPTGEIHRELIRLAMSSIADTAIFPMQDILGLGEEARMNRPATTKGNWQWRLLPEQLSSSHSSMLLEMTEIYGRA